MVFQRKRIYLDYASITPVDSRVFKMMEPYLRKSFANPSSLYIEGLENRRKLEESRENIAKILSAHSDEIIFTSGGTEANNLALLGVYEASKDVIKKPHVVTINIEHPSVLEVCREIERRGGEVTYVEVGKNGIVDPKEIKKAIQENTVLVSVMYANNEIGTLQPIREIAKVIRQERKKKKGKNEYPYFHSDASQAAEYLDLNVERLGVDFMTIDGSKIYGPRGAGLLFGRRQRNFQPIIWGGGQETGRRSDQQPGRRPGTENLAAAVGLAAALSISEKQKEKESKRLSKLRDYFITEIKKNSPTATLNGDSILRLPNNINFCFPNLDAEMAVLRLDAKGIAASSVTSCRLNNDDSSSYVIEALNKDDCSKSSLRISLGRGTTKKEIDFCLKILYNVVNGGTN